jgi:3',5'-cyclic AMP phosphodiesterase CpdA
VRGTSESLTSRAACYRFTIRKQFAAALALLAGSVAAGAASADTGILAIGDFGVGGETQATMGAAMERFAATHRVHVLATLGDNDYTESPAAFRRNWRRSFGWAEERDLEVAGTLGNHDVRVQGGRYQFDLLGMPRRFYKRRVGDVALFVLDSSRIGDRQTRWLRRRLDAATAPWKVVLLHHPAYTCGAYRSHPEVVRRWVPLFERHGVDLVLSGHDHNYQRFAPRRGVTYVVHGGGGARLYGLERCPRSYPRRVVGRKAHGWLYLRARAHVLRVKAVGPAGRFRDRVAIYP